MTKDEAIEILSFYQKSLNNWGMDRIAKAFDMAIEALSQPIVAKHFDIQSGYIYFSPQIAKNVKVVVLCKDCIHWQKTNIETIDGYPVYDCPFCGEWADANGFCSFGERREP